MTMEVRNPLIEQALRAIGHKIGDGLPKGYGFMLLLFGYGDSRELFYISDAERADMIAVMREFIARYEAN